MGINEHSLWRFALRLIFATVFLIAIGFVIFIMKRIKVANKFIKGALVELLIALILAQG